MYIIVANGFNRCQNMTGVNIITYYSPKIFAVSHYAVASTCVTLTEALLDAWNSKYRLKALCHRILRGRQNFRHGHLHLLGC